MAARDFTPEEWTKIRRELNRNPVRYGLPQREYGSVVIGSFNIRKLGALKGRGTSGGRDEETMRFLADVGRHFDLLAVQEVLPEMTGVRKLRELMGPEYGLIVSDIIGTFPGEQGNEERLAYIYNRSLVQRTELVTEVTASRTRVLKAIARNHQALFDVMESSAAAKKQRTYYGETLPAHLKDLRAGNRSRRPKEPSFSIKKVPDFVQFIRTPFGVGFRVQGHPGLERYEFIAVNAHLHYGRRADRRAEAAALVEWILGKVRGADNPNVLLLGDLNFDFDNRRTDFKRVRDTFEALGGFEERKGRKVFVSFPFIFPHPGSKQDQGRSGEIFRSNIRGTESFDQIGVFSSDDRMANRLETLVEGHSPGQEWGQPGGPDYGVFDFADLFFRALKGKGRDELPKAQATAFYKRFEHKVSDHMPIWFRMPLPRVPEGGRFPTKA